MAFTTLHVLAVVTVCIWGPHLQTTSADLHTPYCTVYNSTGTETSSGPPSPDLPLQYQTTIEANLVEMGRSMTAHEYFDHPGNRATLQMLSKDTKYTIIFDYQTDEIFYVKGSACLISNLTTDDNNVLFGDHENNGVPHTFTTGGALHFTKSMGEQYMGNETVRGIPCDRWRACLYWPQLQSNFTLDYYFTVPNWEDPVNTPQIPVRALATGVMMMGNGQWMNFTHYYDYVDFKPTLPADTTIFETPKGVLCANRKLTKPVPQLPQFYHYRQEIITDGIKKIFQADVWYDSKSRYIRYDYRLDRLSAPLYTMNPITEVHDYHYGVRYVKDQVTGHCVTASISNSTFDVAENTTVSYSNGSQSYAIHMKDPMNLFYLDDKYAYTGQRMARGLKCNVFTSRRTDYPLGNKRYTAVFEYYFLADGYEELPDDGISTPDDVPIFLEVTIDEDNKKYHVSYNFLDFDAERVDISIFDVSTCYLESAKLQFRVRFPGSYKTGTFDSIRKSAQTLFSDIMNVTPIRVQDVRLDYDNSQLYISATLLDRSPYSAQFTYISSKALENTDNKVIPQTMAPNTSECKRLCVTNPDFTCNSFDYCSHDTTGTCRLSKLHFGDGVAKIINSTCDHYSRTVNGPARQELSLTAAYAQLRTAVYSQGLTIDLQMMSSMVSYKAVDVQVTFGWLTPKPLPSLAGQFSYHLEITSPKIRGVYDSHIFYDSKYRLVRYDLVNTHPSPPFFNIHPISEIHDFSNGLAYTMDKTLGNCSIAPLQAGSFDVALQHTPGYVVKMKSPLQLFYLNGTYRYAGQRTIRGMLCDVFEDYRNDFQNNAGKPQLTIFQFYFMSSNWQELSEDSGKPVRSQPIALVISAAGGGFTMTYNFFDFSEQEPDLSNFDIRPCYAGNQQRHFLIKFQGNYHPTLDTHLKDFMQGVQLMLKFVTAASSLRFQDPEITYEGAFTYYLGTMVEQAPFLLDFTKTSNNVAIYRANKTIKNVRSDQSCAALCRTETTFDCESFDYCASAMQCQLSRKHQSSSGPGLRLSQICDHYSKTVSLIKNIEPTVDEAFQTLKNYVYIRGLNVSIQNMIYRAVVFNTDILRPDSQDTTSANMKHFIPSQSHVMYATAQLTYKGLSVDQCAARCLGEATMDCLSFDFCFDTGTCYLSPLHPSQNPKLARTPGMLCDLYGRTFLDSYTAYPGFITQTTGDTIISNTYNADFCAKQCSNTKSYTCRSFDYCPNTKVCTLKQTHILDIPKSAVKSNDVCSHYSRNYVNDFSVTKGKVLSAGQTLHFTNVSLAACAKLCVQNAGFSCKAFTFAAKTSVCNVINVDPKLFQKNITNGTSDLYVRKYFPKGAAQPQPAASSSGYSAGAMGGLAIGMLIPGMVIGAALLYFIRTKRLVKEEELRMGFMNMNHDHEENYGDRSTEKPAVDDESKTYHEYDTVE